MYQHPKQLHLRAAVIRAIREFFESKSFLEVETPLRIPANAPEEHIEPYHSQEWYLQTSPEVCMKRLLSRGYDRIFQISRCWRKAERGSRHLPEFTMLEWYRAGSDYRDLMTDCKDLLRYVAMWCCPSGTTTWQGKRLMLTADCQHITVSEAFQRYSDRSMEQSVRDGSFDECIVTQIEPALPHDRPVILHDYPAEMAALARLNLANPAVAERFELYLGGLELANGFSELNDAEEQRVRFESANQHRSQAGQATLPLPEPFLRDLNAMPPSAGIALGVDRLVMLLANVGSIDEVVAFTPEEL